ncbi:MAG: DNA polymerase III subunit alpha [Bacteroidia bacterium]|nr:DNA polymerase III subunit alpha [Bacteroidia bacterium]
MYLNCHTRFSLRYGVLSVAELVELAALYGIPALALTDIHNTSAAYDFVRMCREKGIHPVLGMEFRNGDDLLYVALAKNLKGFQEINTYYSKHAHKKQPFPEIAPLWSEVYVIYPWRKRERTSLSEHEFLGVHPREIRQVLRSRYHHRQDKLLVHQPLTFVDKRGHNIHRLLRSVDHNILLSKLMNRMQAGEGEAFVPPNELREIYSSYPKILYNTEKLLENCSFPFIFEQPRTRQTFTGAKYDDMILLEKLAKEGLAKRYGPNHAEALRRMERELEIVEQLDFNAYFLITWDMVRYGQSRGFFHVGRGSGANSITAYCLGITDVDPIELDLYFERFLNPKRTSPPDFDIDFSWTDRDDVIDYMMKRYRYSHTSLLATYNRYKNKGSIRELGKVFGLPKEEIDLLVAKRDQPDPGLSKLSRQVLHYSKLISGFPNHLSIHAGGILISDDPIHAFTATDLPPKGFPITHFDMYVAEEIGLHKFDVLSQRGLGHIRSCVEIVEENQGKSIDVHAVNRFKQDEDVKEILRKGQTVGCFYVESPAMRGLLSKLRCDDYLTLVAASSIIRPGVARSGMMQAYIRRHNGESFQYPHFRLRELLHDTYGIMVYQEDVIKVVNGFAGLSLSEADMLRRAMSGKSREKGEFGVVKERFLTACREKGYDEAISQEIWRQIESFAGYSFSKAHSASFAVESFQSLYLKAHYPLEFMTAVVNNFGGFYDTEIYLHEAHMLGAKIHAPCVNTSTWETRIIGKDIYLGFIHLKDMDRKIAQAIEPERGFRGKFEDMADFVRRIPLSVEQLTILIRIGAFRFTGKSKPQLLWEMRLHLKQKAGNKQAEVLFLPKQHDFDLPDLKSTPLEDAYDEMELLGYPICSPFDLLKPLPPNAQHILYKDFPKYVGRVVRVLGYLICTKTTATIKGDRMQFANFFDIKGEMFDVTRFPNVVHKYPFVGRGIYLITGKVVDEFGHFSIEMTEMRKWLYLPDPRQEDERVGV